MFNRQTESLLTIFMISRHTIETICKSTMTLQTSDNNTVLGSEDSSNEDPMFDWNKPIIKVY